MISKVLAILQAVPIGLYDPTQASILDQEDFLCAANQSKTSLSSLTPSPSSKHTERIAQTRTIKTG